MAASAGGSSSAAVTEDGRLFMWGEADVLGTGVLLRAGREEAGDCHRPVHVRRSLLGGRRVVAAACGQMHTAAVDSRGALWIWGEGELLGNPSWAEDGASSVAVPRRLRVRGWGNGGNRVEAVACGEHHTVVLAAGGRVFSFGFGPDGELGHGDADFTAVPTALDPQLSFDNSGIVSVSCGKSHTCACSANGDVYSWGCNEHGQLGQGDVLSQRRPALVERRSFYARLPPREARADGARMVHVSCGRSHSIAISGSGAVWVWGWGEYGQLGLGDTRDRNVPTKLPGLCEGRGEGAGEAVGRAGGAAEAADLVREGGGGGGVGRAAEAGGGENWGVVAQL